MRIGHVNISWLLGFVLALAVAVHLGLPFAMRRTGIAFSPPSDPLEYRVLAYHLVHDHAFSVYSKEMGSLPELLRTPAYPIFIAMIEEITGSLLWVVLMQQLLLFASSYWVFKSILALTKKPFLASCAGIFFLFEPLVLFFSLQTWSETLFLFFLSLALYVVTNAKRKETPFLLGVLFALLVLTRPIGVLVLPLFCIPWLETLSWRNTGKRVGLFFLGAAILLSPWLYRNWTLTRDLVLSSSGTYNSIAGVYGLLTPQTLQPLTISSYDDRAVYDPDSSMVEGRSLLYTTPWWPTLKRIEAAARTQVSMGASIVQQVRCVPHVWVRGWGGIVFEKYGKSRTALLQGILNGIEILFYFIILIVSLFGCTSKKYLTYTIPLGATVLAVTVLNLCISSTRMRTSILPVILILAAIGTAHWIERFGKSADAT